MLLGLEIKQRLFGHIQWVKESLSPESTEGTQACFQMGVGEDTGSQMGGAHRIPDGGSIQDSRWGKHPGSQIGGTQRTPDGRSTQDPRRGEHPGSHMGGAHRIPDAIG